MHHERTLFYRAHMLKLKMVQSLGKISTRAKLIVRCIMIYLQHVTVILLCAMKIAKSKILSSNILRQLFVAILTGQGLLIQIYFIDLNVVSLNFGVSSGNPTEQRQRTDNFSRRWRQCKKPRTDNNIM